MNLLYTLTAYPPSTGGAQLHQHMLAQQMQHRHGVQVVSQWRPPIALTGYLAQRFERQECRKTTQLMVFLFIDWAFHYGKKPALLRTFQSITLSYEWLCLLLQHALNDIFIDMQCMPI
jgi:hypothetical protein